MIFELGISTVMVLATVCLHGGGLVILGWMLRRMDQLMPGGADNSLAWIGAPVAIATTLGLLILHGFEIWLYAGLYHLNGAVPDLREAVYFSTITFAAIGFSDAAIAPAWKLVGAIEGINGVLLLGWSVAFLVAEMTRYSKRRAPRA